MDLDLTDEQEALRQAAEDLFAKEASIAAVRAAEPLGFDPDLWATVRDLGLTTIAVPESEGGGGGGMLDLAVVAEQLGRSLAPVPLVEAVAANHALAGTGGGAGLLDEVVADGALATLALHPAVDGVARLVSAGAVADVVVALDGDELVAVRDGGVGPTSPAGSVPNLGALPLADRALDGDRVVLASGPSAHAAHREARAVWEALTGVALVGVGDRALEIGLAYVMEREAFGVLIASFQTIQHRLADDATALDGARLLAYEAAWARDVGLAGADELATMAALFAGESAFTTAAHCLQFHGGYGYTLEYDIQLYFRRAKAWSLLAGDPRARYADLGDRLYGEAGG